MFGIDQIGVEDNFFELQGDSLLAAQVIAAASREFRVQVPIRSIFGRSTISRLAQAVDDLRQSAELLIAAPGGHISDDEEEGSI
jgi:acyl carrier protein